MNKLIFNDVGLWPHSHELCELSRSLINRGHKVYFLSSNDSFIGNPSNPLSFNLASIVTKMRNTIIHKELAIHGVNCSFLSNSNKYMRNKFRNNISENLLNSIFGSYCEILRDGLADRKSFHYLNFEKKALLNLEKSYEFLEFFIQKNKIEEIIVWNGRRPGEVLLIDLAKLKFIRYSSIISSQINGRYSLRENWSNVNDIKLYSEEIKKKLFKFKKEGFNKKSLKKAALYYKRAQGLIDKPKSFNSKGFYTYSEKYKISENLNKKISHIKSLNKKLVSIFPGTFMEYISLPDYSDDPLHANHYDHIKFLLSLNLEKTHHFILRFHPNQRLVRFNEKLELNNIFREAKSKSNFDVILPNQNISSYEVIKKSDLIIGIGSSISVEALRMKKKVLFLGCNWFQELEALYKPKSQKDIVNFLNSSLQYHPNSKRDSTLFTETFLDENHTKFKYYKSIEQIVENSYLNIFLRKCASFMVIFSKFLFVNKFLIIYFFLRRINK